MSVPFKFEFEFEPVVRSFDVDAALPATTEAGEPIEWVVWAYHGFLKNFEAPSQTNVAIAFRRLGDGVVFEEVIRVLPAAALNVMSIGSIWQGKRSERQAVFESPPFFDVDYTLGKWRFNSFAQARKTGKHLPHPRRPQVLSPSASRVQYLELFLPTGGRLVIPCLEFFVCLYGEGHYLRQILLSEPWEPEGSAANKLYAELRKSPDEGQWGVCLRRRLNDTDAVFLAHAKYDPFTMRAAKSPYTQLEASHRGHAQEDPVALVIGPWHQGKAQLAVEGFSFDEGQSFLALRIIGRSRPRGPKIEVDRDNTNFVEEPAPKGSPERAWAGTVSRHASKTELTGRDEPDHGAPDVEIPEPELMLLGPERDMGRVSKEQAESTSAAHRRRRTTDVVSTGEPHGASKGVGRASIHNVQVPVPKGLVLMMWQAARALRARYPDFIERLEWYTPSEGYSDAPEPRLIGLSPFLPDAPGARSIAPSVRRWLYLDTDGPLAERAVRGVLVMRLIVEGRSIHLFEIQRRWTAESADGDESGETAEHYAGLAIEFDDDEDLRSWLPNFLSQVRFEKGKIAQVLETVSVPGREERYPHRLSGAERPPGQQIVLNALRRYGLERPTRK